MKRVSRLLLGLVTTAIPIVIAACYGVAYRFAQRGRVIDSSSKVGVAGLTVECRDARDVMSDQVRTSADGIFDLYAPHESDCTTITVEDDRGVTPRYAPATAAPDPGGRDITIEVAPLP